MLEIHTVLCRPEYMNNYAYIITDTSTGTTAVIDPSEAGPVIDELTKLNKTPQFVLNTHHHFDHVEGNLELVQKYGAKIACNQADIHRVKGAEIALVPDTLFKIGNLETLIIDVSAHTQGHILFYFPKDKALFTGDTLFNLCVGGLFEGTPEQMFNALHKIKSLPDDVSFYPGHEYTLQAAEFAFQYNHGNPDIQKYLDYAHQRLEQGLPASPTLLRDEKRCNPYLEVSTIQEFKNHFFNK